jgi:hypothetical protein
MGATGGPPESVSVAGREFACTGDADVSRMLGGYTNEHQSNGNKTTRTIKIPVPWTLGGVSVVIDDDNGDQEFLEAVKDGQDDVDIVISYTSGASYAAVGNIDGDLSYSNNSAAASFDLKGPGKLKKL